MPPKDKYGFGVSKSAKQSALDYAVYNRNYIKNFIEDRPSIKKTYDDLIKDINSNKLNINFIPENEWDAYQKKNWKGDRTGMPNGPGGWYSSSDNSIHVKDSKWGREKTLPHEIMHYFASHGKYDDSGKLEDVRHGVPESINPYIRADMKLGGWLPSFHPAGRRPTLPAKTKLGKQWNEQMTTKDTDYSDARGYHPWFDEEAFDRQTNKPSLLQFVKGLFHK
jgi:hypothetical protein